MTGRHVVIAAVVLAVGLVLAAALAVGGVWLTVNAALDRAEALTHDEAQRLERAIAEHAGALERAGRLIAAEVPDHLELSVREPVPLAGSVEVEALEPMPVLLPSPVRVDVAEPVIIRGPDPDGALPIDPDIF